MTKTPDTAEEFLRLQLSVEETLTMRSTVSSPEVDSALRSVADKLAREQVDLLKRSSSPAPMHVIYNQAVIDNLPFGSVGYFEDTKGRVSVKLSDGWSDGSKAPLTLWSLGQFA